MRRKSTVGLVLFLVSVASTNVHAALKFVDGGQPACVLVVADEPTAAASQGAADLQMWLKRSSGATVPIRKESEAADAPNTTRILIGDTQQTRSLGVKSEELGLEEIIVKTFPRALVIIGDDERPDGVKLTGTVLAVDVFAEDFLGVRMLWPGPLGEIVPKRKTIRVGNISIRRKPTLLQRSVGNHAFNGAIHDNIDALGWDQGISCEFHAQNYLE